MSFGAGTDTLEQENVSFKSGQTWCDFEFDLLLKIDDTQQADSRYGRDDLLNKLEVQVRRVSNVFAEAIQTNGNILGDVLDRSHENAELFPWVAYFDRQIVVNSQLSRGFLPKLFDIAQPLVGQSARDIDVVICEAHTEPWAHISTEPSVYELDTPEDLMKAVESMTAPRNTSNDLQLLIVRISSIYFQEGTLYKWVKGHIQVLTLAATLLSPFVAIGAERGALAAQNAMASIELHHRVAKAVEGEPMAKYRNFQISFDDLEREAGNAFNYERRGLSDDERRWRIACVQVALKVSLRIDLKVDGVMGPETINALKEFARLHNHPATVTNPFTRRDLLDVFRPTEARK